MKKIYLLSAFFLAAFFSFTSTYAVVPVNNGGVPVEKIDAAVNDFNQLSKAEKKQRLKEVKKEINHFKALKKKGMDADDRTILLVILAILLPPLAVYLHQGTINNKFWISLILTLLFWAPGVIYALLVVLGVA